MNNAYSPKAPAHSVIQNQDTGEYWTGHYWAQDIGRAKCYSNSVIAVRQAQRLGLQLAGDDSISFIAVTTFNP